MTLATGAATAAEYVPASRVNQDRVNLRGGWTGSVASGTTITTLAAAFHPAAKVELSVNVVMSTLAVGAALVQITTAGVVTLVGNGTMIAFNFDWLGYDLV